MKDKTAEFYYKDYIEFDSIDEFRKSLGRAKNEIKARKTGRSETQLEELEKILAVLNTLETLLKRFKYSFKKEKDFLEAQLKKVLARKKKGHILKHDMFTKSEISSLKIRVIKGRLVLDISKLKEKFNKSVKRDYDRAKTMKIPTSMVERARQKSGKG